MKTCCIHIFTVKVHDSTLVLKGAGVFFLFLEESKSKTSLTMENNNKKFESSSATPKQPETFSKRKKIKERDQKCFVLLQGQTGIIKGVFSCASLK